MIGVFCRCLGGDIFWSIRGVQHAGDRRLNT